MAKRNPNRKVRCLVAISDTHCGCRVGLCPAGGVPLDDGGEYHISPVQKFMWQHWQEFWNNWVPRVTKGEPFAVVHNGDATDGVPHRATTPISHNLDDQQEVAYRALAPVVDLCEGRYYHIRGTEAHVGKSSVEEERLAKRLGAIPNSAGQYARYELWKEVGKGLVHFAHHIGVTTSAQHESAAVNAELIKMFNEAARWQTRPPDMVVRSHRHSYCEVIIPIHRDDLPKNLANRQRGRCVVTPSWQAKTPFAYRVARGKPPQFGGILIRWDGQVLYTEAYCATFRDNEVE